MLWLGEVAAARATLDSLLSEHPREPQAHTLRGALALFKDFDASLGVRELLRGARLAPWSSEAAHYSAYAHLVDGDTSAARKAIERALQQDPLSPALDGDAGMVRYLLGDLAAADSLCARGIRGSAPSRALVSCRLLVAEATNNLPRRDSLLGQLRDLHPEEQVTGDSTLAGLIARKADQGAQALLAAPTLTDLRWLAMARRDGLLRQWVAVQPLGHPLVALARHDPVVRRATGAGR
jgi:hypothetical protein